MIYIHRQWNPKKVEPKNFGFGFRNQTQTRKPKKKNSKPKNPNFFGFSELNFRKIEVSIYHSICLNELIRNMSLFSLKMVRFKNYGVKFIKNS